MPVELGELGGAAAPGICTVVVVVGVVWWSCVFWGGVACLIRKVEDCGRGGGGRGVTGID